MWVFVVGKLTCACFGCSPVDYVEQLGWLGDDVWLAHALHLDDDAIDKIARTATGVAHCPTSNARLGAEICRTRDLLDAGANVGLGVDGAASNEACALLEEVRHALLFARARNGPKALTVRDALEMATIGGARLLGRDAEIGSLEPGKLADIAVWRMDTLAHIDISDPVAALVLGAPPPLELLLVNGSRSWKTISSLLSTSRLSHVMLPWPTPRCSRRLQRHD